ncbi:MAG: hypothetical protein JW750_02380 [Anaerolineaceae bacterium]|nr:hypothetical protein [Anaerolineaceae bacterium]
MNPKIRFGILLHSTELPAWAIHALKAVAAAGDAECRALILTKDGKPTASTHGPFYDRLHALDHRLFASAPYARTPVDLRPLYPDLPIIQINTLDDLCLINSSIDLLLQFNGDLPQTELLDASAFGLWTYSPEHAEHPFGFWEVAEQAPETTASLYAVTREQPSPEIIDQAALQTHPHSPAQNRDFIHWASAAFLPRQLRRLRELGAEQFYRESRAKYAAPAVPPKSIPNRQQMIKETLKLGSRVLRRSIQKACFHDQWRLLYQFDAHPPFHFETFSEIKPPPDRMWADPHVIAAYGKYFIFIEEMIFSKQRGHLAVMEMDEEGNYTAPVPVLEKDYHLSYPFVFQDENTYYMIPESAENRTIDLYECESFPTRWKHKMTLMSDVLALDTTLLHAYGKWWMFTALAANEGAFPQTELYLFHADHFLTAQWMPCALNPIKSDIKSARPAGQCFRDGDKWFRISQDCSGRYGYGFNISEIIELSASHYAEEVRQKVVPDWNKAYLATHTFSTSSRLTVIDCLTRRWKWF